MMGDSQRMEEETSVLRWGGLAGILGSLLLILVFGIVIVFVGADPAEPEGLVTRFPDIRAARTIENSLYLVVLILWVAPFLALYRVLRESNLAPAIFGSVLGILGLVVLAAGALPHVATKPISDLYHAPGTTPEEQVTLVLVWQATQGIFDALLGVGFFVLPVGIIALGVAMFDAPAFGKGIGGVSVGLGVVGIVAASVFVIAPPAAIAALVVLALIIFHLIVGWKLYRLSTAPQGVWNLNVGKDTV